MITQWRVTRSCNGPRFVLLSAQFSQPTIESLVVLAGAVLRRLRLLLSAIILLVLVAWVAAAGAAMTP